MGVKGFNIDGGSVVGMAVVYEGKYLLTVTENGYGKQTPIEEFRIVNRGAKGVKALNITDKTGNLICLKAVNGDEDCILMSDDGIVIRISLSQVNTHGRASSGVKLINLKEGSKVSNISILEPEVEEEIETTEE